MPWRVLAVDGSRVSVELAGVRRDLIGLATPDVRAGDYVVVAGSMVVRRLSPEAAAGIARALDGARQPPDHAQALPTSPQT